MIERLELSEAEDGLVVYDESIDRVHHLNPTAAVILQLCDGTRDAQSIAEFLAQGYGLDEAPLEQTVATLEKLSQEGLIR
jgi:PqqD family protein of HPr-rel-A system